MKEFFKKNPYFFNKVGYRFYSIFGALLISYFTSDAQVQNIGIGTTNPNNSAILDISSDSKGLLIPRLKSDQINSIKDPATGLLVFNTDKDNFGFYYYNGEIWRSLTQGDVNSVATGDINGWSLNGNESTISGVKAAATSLSYLGTPSGVPINFKIGGVSAGVISSSNLLLGLEAGLSNIGGNTIAIGYRALKNNLVNGSLGFNNLAVGAYSLASNTNGYANVAIGSAALEKNTLGYSNVAIGVSSLGNNLVGESNIAIGAYSLLNNVSGHQNFGMGKQTLLNLISGGGNTAIGNDALRSTNGSNNTGIGYRSGYSNLGSNNIFIGYQSGYNETGSNKLYIANSNTVTPLIYGDFSAKFLSIGDVPVAKRDAVASSGQYSLIVEKGILSEKLKVALKTSADWADYVFEPEYKANMLSLEEVEKFTLENKHLPNVPSAKELVEKGLDFNETSRMFMEKIEELTLYLIELNKEIKVLKAENEKFRNK